MTEMLKFEKSPSFALLLMNFMMSGCQTFKIPMLAPRLLPPCLITSVAELKTRMNDTGPDATPSVERTGEPSARKCEKLYPVPPPDWWMIAPQRIASKISGRESFTGRVKHAESCPSGVPAFMRVGEFGRKDKLIIAWKYSSVSSGVSPRALATRRQTSSNEVSPARK